jgi:cobalamin biosynthetic protein CobC
MVSPSYVAPLAHGGNLAAARELFPGAPEPFLDLSTGINPNPYKVPELAADLWTKLSEATAVSRLAAIAAKAYGAPSPAYVVAGPGTQILMALAAGLRPPGRAAILAPTYAEHARLARLAGHQVAEVADEDALGDAAIAIVVNPNNPNGRIVTRDKLLEIAERLRACGGMLIVDEAFMEVGPDGTSLAGEVTRGNILVLRSFGKFYGLPGLRLSFALAGEDIVARLNASLGPWPVSGPALAIGAAALADTKWQEVTCINLTEAASRLDAMLIGAGLEAIGGTSLFRLVQSERAAELFQHLGRAGILTRRFTAQPSWLRFGLPGDESEWQWLAAALTTFPANRRS